MQGNRGVALTNGIVNFSTDEIQKINLELAAFVCECQHLPNLRLLMYDYDIYLEIITSGCKEVLAIFKCSNGKQKKQNSLLQKTESMEKQAAQFITFN